MSWLSDLANKAEAFLEKVDQTAASSLNIEEQNQGTETQTALSPNVSNAPNVPNVPSISSLPPKPLKSNNTAMPLNHTKKGETHPQLPRPVSVPNFQTGHASVEVKKPPAIKKGSEDDPLFEFLNNSAIPAGGTRRTLLPKTSTPIKGHTQVVAQKADVEQKLQGENKQTGTTQGESKIATESTKEDDKPFEDDATLSSALIVRPTDDAPAIEESKDPIVTTMQSPVPMKNIASERLSNLELENKLLKGEMSSLNEELANSLRKSKDVQEELNKAKADLTHFQEKLELKDKDIQIMTGNEKDYKESIGAKDSQLAVLRVRIQEADEELKAKSSLLESLQNENERVLRDHSESTGVQNIALDNIQLKLEEMEETYNKEKEGHDKTRNELVELRSKYQTEQQEMALSVKQLQSKLNEEKSKARELEQNSKTASENAGVAQRELKEYREKATRILQAKEKLIMSLKQGTPGSDASPLILTELEDIKQERDFLREDLQQAKYKLEQVRGEIQELERQHQAESDEQITENEALQQSLQYEQRRRQHAEDDSQRLQQDLRLLREDVQRQKKFTIEQLQERESEIRDLRHQIAIKSTTSASQEELENRVRSLTESLIQKQTLVETLSTEKSSLTLQLERLEQQYRDVQQSLLKRPQNFRTSGNSLHEVEDLEEGQRLQSIASIMPTPMARSRHWKSTVNEIDKFSIRLGLFLRRYPIARLFVILYMFILHLWVTVVLLTYKPEIHSSAPPGASDPMPHKR